MISIYMFITALAVTALAKGKLQGAKKCSLSESIEAQQCFGALGEPLIFYLPTDGNTTMKSTQLKKHTLYRIFDNTRVNTNKNYSDSEFITNGTWYIMLETATKKHSGDYVLETHGATDGWLLQTINVHLEIQAPVSKPVVSQMCLSPERMNISCSSEGDGVEFIFSLDSLVLMQTRGHSQSQKNWAADLQSLSANATKQEESSVSYFSISLYGQPTGNLMCQVKNNVSNDTTVLQLTSCKGSICWSPATVGVMAVGICTTLLLILSLFLGIKHLNKKKRTQTVNEDNAADEVIYSDVRVKKHTRNTRPNSHQNAA